MVYPATPLPVELGVQLGGTWVDAVTTGDGVLHRAGITIDAGRGNWAGQVDPARLNAAFRDSDGRWSPDLVTGAHFGHLRRNAPVRCGVGLGDTYLRSGPSSACSTPNNAALNITGDIDVRVEFELSRDPVDELLGTAFSYYVASRLTGNSGWEIVLRHRDGQPVIDFFWGNGTTQFVADSTDTGSAYPWSIMHDRVAIRVTFDVNNGASGRTITFYHSTSIGGTWTQVGSPVVQAGTTSIGSASTTLYLGGTGAFGAPMHSRIHAFELRNGIGGTVVANPVMTSQAVGASGFTDGAGRVWTVTSGAALTNMRWRFHGELSKIPVRWDLSGADMHAPIEAAGPLRRLRQGNQPLESAMRRAITRRSFNFVQYWPCEETGSALTQFGAAIGTAPMLVYQGGTLRGGTNDDHPGSLPLAETGTTRWAAFVDGHQPGADGWQTEWLMSIAADATGTERPIFRVSTSSGLIWEVWWRENNAGDLAVRGYKNSSTVTYDSGWVAFSTKGIPLLMHLECSVQGANVGVSLTGTPVGGVSGGVSNTSAITVATPGVPQQVIVNQFGTMAKMAVGHITVQDFIASNANDDALAGHAGEPAARRIQRLCTEEGVRVRCVGDPLDTEPVGVQHPLPLVDLLEEAADTDGGILSEAIDDVALSYRTRVHIQTTAATTLSYSGGEVTGTPHLDRDDSAITNDVTVRTVDGGDGRAVLDDGTAMSISQPPTGVGRYPTSYSANPLQSRAADLAGWRLRLGTVDEPRVSNLVIDTNRSAIAGNATLLQTVLGLRLGTKLTVTGLPAMAITGSIKQVIQAIRETISMFNHELALVTTSATPWELATYDGTEARYDTAGSQLAAAASAGATSLSVATTLGPLWTTASGDMPMVVKVGGVRVTVTAVSGSSSPQTFTVSAIPVALAINAKVELADPSYYEL